MDEKKITWVLGLKTWMDGYKKLHGSGMKSMDGWMKRKLHDSGMRSMEVWMKST